MIKRVRYNGGTGSYKGCSDPAALVVDKEYEVTAKIDRGGFQTDYMLNGVKGEYNSVWFDELPDINNSTHIAIGRSIPEKGKVYECFVIQFAEHHPELVRYRTSVVKEVTYRGNNIYEFKTSSSSIYIVTVG